MASQSSTPNLTYIVKEICNAGDSERVTVADMVTTFSHRGFGTLLLIPALITFLPTGGIPGVPIVCAIVIVFVATQLLIGRNEPWLPKKLKKVSVDRAQLRKLIDKSLPVTRRIDYVIKPRFGGFITPLTTRVTALISLIIGLAFIPLGPIPFAAALPSGVLLIIALGLVARDGLAMLLGFAFCVLMLVVGPVLIFK